MAKKRAAAKKRAVKKRAVKKTAARKRTPAAGAHEALVVTISGERSIHEVASDLTARGFKVGQVLDAIGSVTGHAPANTRGKLKSIRGVADVRQDQPVDIGPPGAKETW